MTPGSETATRPAPSGPRPGSPADRFRVGVVGAGFIADYHLQILSRVSGIDLVGVCDVDRVRAQHLRDRWSAGEACASVMELVERGRPDVVHVLVPPEHHVKVAVQCLQSGCHVFLEKPAATSYAECRQIQAEAQIADRKVGVNYNMQHHPLVSRAVGLIASTTLGRIEHISACWHVPLRQLRSDARAGWIFRAPENVLLEQAVHPLSVVELLVGRVGAASALASGRRDSNRGTAIYDRWQVSLECERGTAQCLFSFDADFREQSLHIVGEDGSAFLDLRRNTMVVREKTRFMEPVDDLIHGLSQGASLTTQTARNFVDYAGSFLKLAPRSDPFFISMRESISAFYAALRGGHQPPVTIDDAADTVRAIEMIVRSQAC